MSGLTRRDFTKGALLVGAGVWVTGTEARAAGKSPNEKLNVGVIGVGGRGGANLDAVKGENVVALCDIDDGALNGAAAGFPSAAKYSDWRKLLDRNDLDAVVVSTPDHHHAFATVRALRQGLHVYCEKPLTRTISEARAVAKAAREAKVATQMGTQGHSMDGSRRNVELLQSGVIGAVREVHAWTDRPIWPQGIDRPTGSSVPPSSVHWDLWLGPAPERPFVEKVYHPFAWRGWWDFGTGALGDMACHILDVSYWSLKLDAPTSVEAQVSGISPESAPKWSIITWQFPQRGDLAPTKLVWYDGGKKPSAELFEGKKVEDNGTLFIGDKGKLYCPDAYCAATVLLPESQYAGFQGPAPYLPRTIGHHQEWIQACKGGKPTGSHFEYAAGLTETVLLGNLAVRTGKHIEWDAKRMRAKDCPEADDIIRPEYRKGWSLHG
jgi:predicted dehydrogenase